MAGIPAGLLVVCGSSTGLPSETPRPGLPMCSLMFLLLCGASTFPSQETVNSVFDNPRCEGLFQELSLPLGRVTSSVEAFFFSFSICKLSFVPHPQPRGPNHKSNLERFYDSGKVKVPVT